MKFLIILILFALSAASVSVRATTWGEKEFPCPVCSETNTYNTPISYGSYIYQWPSKYQLIFWPKTDKLSHYICKDCGFSCFMGDLIKFDSTNKTKVKEMLAKVKPVLNFSNYDDCPILKRLELSEKCYKEMNKDEYFWCEYYRVKAYFCEAEGDSAQARRYRMKALGTAEQMLAMEKYGPIAKELLFIIGSMYYYTGSRTEAAENLKACKGVVYKGIDMDEKNASALNDYLMVLTEEFLTMIEQESGK